MKRQESFEDAYVDSCLNMSMNGIGSIEEILEMPSSRWFIISSRMKKWQQQEQGQVHRR